MNLEVFKMKRPFDRAVIVDRCSAEFLLTKLGGRKFPTAEKEFETTRSV